MLTGVLIALRVHANEAVNPNYKTDFLTIRAPIASGLILGTCVPIRSAVTYVHQPPFALNCRAPGA